MFLLGSTGIIWQFAKTDDIMQHCFKTEIRWTLLGHNGRNHPGDKVNFIAYTPHSNMISTRGSASFEKVGCTRGIIYYQKVCYVFYIVVA